MRAMHRLNLALIAVLLITFALPVAGLAQEELVESFDDPQLPGWERSPESFVSEGVLRINPGNFALRPGDLESFSISVDLNYSGAGVTSVIYAFRDESSYGFIFDDTGMALVRRDSGAEEFLAGSVSHSFPEDAWFTLEIKNTGGSHEIWIDGELTFEAHDPDPLPSGALLFISDGERILEVDNLGITLLPIGEPEPGDGEPAPGDGEPEPVEPASQPADTSTAGDDQASGLAAFIRQLQVTGTESLELQAFAINLLLAALFSFVLSRAYVHWGFSLANRRKFAANFMLITITTTFIILIVRSSVALSLGLVGALSIVRFRAAIKEPEELAYLFFAIGLGIGLGDNQRLLTLLALIAGLLLIGLMRLLRRSDADVNLHLTVSTAGDSQPSLDSIIEALKAHCTKLELVRYDETKGAAESVFRIEFKSLSSLTTAADALRGLSKAIDVSYLTDRGLS